MPVNGQDALTYICKKTSSAPVIGVVTKNPFYTAVLISLILVLIILFVFRNIDIEHSGITITRLAFRCGIYSLIAVTAVQFLQNQNLINEMKEKYSSKHINDIFDSPTSIDKAEHIPVMGAGESSLPSQPTSILKLDDNESDKELVEEYANKLNLPLNVDFL